MRLDAGGECLIATPITGPEHNLLGLLFTFEPVSDFEVDARHHGAEARRLNADDVVRAALAGVAEANADLDRPVRGAGVRFVLSDTPPADIYRNLAAHLARQWALTNRQS